MQMCGRKQLNVSARAYGDMYPHLRLNTCAHLRVHARACARVPVHAFEHVILSYAAHIQSSGGLTCRKPRI